MALVDAMPVMDDVPSCFRTWACSLSGCDGGDPSAPIWLSGIEWGYAKKRGQPQDEYDAQLRKYYQEDLPKEIAAGSVGLGGPYDWMDSFKYGYGRSLAKLYSAIRGQMVGDCANFMASFPGATLLKLNLYPIAFPDTTNDWWSLHRLEKLTGLASARAYRAWCCVNRFPFIAAMVKEHQPRLIICTGISYLTDFLLCFSGSGGSGIIHEVAVSTGDAPANSRRFYWTKINSGKTTVAVIPFLSGRSGLNSDALIKEVGARLAPLYQ